MTTTLAARLPGVTFEVPPRAPRDVLPRMDIAGFVGLAASGPVDVPVAVESADRFREIFGPDLPLARADGARSAERSYLGQAVEAFFRDGGLRCWVVRVAERPTAGRFGVPGLVSLYGDRAAWALGAARARSGGSWSDGLRVGAVLRVTQLAPDGSSPRPEVLDPGGGTLRLEPASQVAAGDLLRLGPAGGGGRLVVAVTSVADEADARSVAWDPDHAAWLTPPPSGPGKPPAAAWAVHRLTADGPRPVDVQVAPAPGPQPPDAGPMFDVGLPDATGIGPGDVLRVDVGGAAMLLPVIGRIEPGGAIPRERIRMRAGPGWVVERGRRPAGQGWWSDAGTALVVERLELDLLVWRGERLEARLDGLGLTPSHPRAWSMLPGDDALFRRLTGAPDRAELSALALQALSPRFPLATAHAGGGARPDPPPMWLPIGVPATPDAALAAEEPSGGRHADPLERDGLGAFGATLFIDGRLAPTTAREVLPVASDIAFLADGAAPLRGLHALFPIEEVTLLALPDAGRPGWRRVGLEGAEPLAAPELTLEVIGPDEVELTWTAVAGATEYALDQSDDDPAFSRALTRYRGREREVALYGFGACPARRSFRVRALAGARPGPWSGTVEALLPAAVFETCDPAIEVPRLRLAVDGSPPEGIALSWTEVEADGYEVALSSDPDFRAHESLAIGAGETQTQADAGDDGPVYARIRAYRDPPPAPPGTARSDRRYGGWSNTVARAAAAEAAWLAADDPAGPDEDLLSVHRAVLRLCAARGDILAVLALPAGYRQGHAAEHVARLAPRVRERDEPARIGAAGVPPLDGGEEHALSYGAVYHPWVAVRADGGDGPQVVSIPPDGGACGRIARRSIARGPWIAPANEALEGVLAADPALARDAEAALLRSGVNVIRRDPRGFVIAGSDTLATEAPWRPINVRRLLILLRRVVLREGMADVFEPHDRAFRNTVVRRLEVLLSEMYRRGAFAGATSSEAFQVVGDASNNPPWSVDQGRFVVDVMVAPARPMKFIRVRLVQSGPGAVAVEAV